MNQNKRASARRSGFASRLREAMRDEGHIAERGAKSGVNAKALKLAIKLQTVEMARRYLDGEAMPREDKIDQIAAWLKVNVAWLRDGAGPKHGGTVNSLAPAEHELVDAFRHLSEADQNAALTIIRSLRGKKPGS